MEKVIERRAVVGGVDTHKDLHVAAVVDDQDRFLASQSFATTRQGYRLMLEWMRSFGDLQRVGIEATGTYGAGVLRYFQKAGVQVLEVTGPDRHDRRARGKSDTFSAACAWGRLAGFQWHSQGHRVGLDGTRDGIFGLPDISDFFGACAPVPVGIGMECAAVHEGAGPANEASLSADGHNNFENTPHDIAGCKPSMTVL